MAIDLQVVLERLIQVRILSPETTPKVLAKIRASIQQPTLPMTREAA